MGLPSSCVHLFIRATPFDPGRPSDTKQLRHLRIGFRSHNSLAICIVFITRLNRFTSGAPPITACMIPCVRLRYVIRVSPSFKAPTLGTSGWLVLTRRGLSPRQMHQALLGALRDRADYPPVDSIGAAAGLTPSSRSVLRDLPCVFISTAHPVV